MRDGCLAAPNGDDLRGHNGDPVGLVEAVTSAPVASLLAEDRPVDQQLTLDEFARGASRGGVPCSVCQVLDANPHAREQLLAGRRKTPPTSYETMAKFLTVRYGLRGKDITQRVYNHMRKHEGNR